MKRLTFGTVARVAVAALGLAVIGPACGSSSAVNTGPIHIAAVTSVTGTYSDIGHALVEGSKAGIRAVNDAGGVMGRQLVLDVVDTVGDPADAVPAVNKELTTNHPVGVVGPSSLELFALQPIFDRNHVPDMFNGGTTIFDKNTDKWIWRINASDSQLGVALALYAHQKGYTKAALMFSTDESAQTLKPVVGNTFTKLGGQVVADVNVTPNQTSYRSEVLKVVNAHPDVILTQMEPNTAAVAFANFQELNGLSVPFIGTDVTAGSDWIKAVTPALANKVMTSVEGSSQSGAGGDAFMKYNQLVNGHAPLASANFAYDGVVLLALAMQKAGSTSPDAIVGAMTQISNPPGDVVGNYKDGLAALTAGKKINYEGASGPMDFDQYHNVSGPWDVVKAQPDGSVQILVTLSAADVAAAA
jgi:ABC-type branched-subunit amino acid transport system substrate-binding protein